MGRDMTSAKALRQRWTLERAVAARDALENWKKSKRLEEVAFGVHEGRLDLRGLAICTNISGVDTKHVSAGDVSRDYSFVTLDNPPEFHSAKWTSIDFSHAEIDHLRLFLSEVRDCRFVGATLRDWRNWGVHYSDCDFSGADLQNANVGGTPYKGKRVEYANCLWRKGKLKAVTLSGGLYRDCRFEDVKLAKEQVTDADFIGCHFSGRLEEIRFDGRNFETKMPWDVRPDAMVRCDFSECSLVDVQFLGIDVRGIELPPSGQRMPHISRVARAAYEWAQTADLAPNERMFLDMYWAGYVTKLPDEAEGWLDLSAFEGPGKALLERSMAA
jgi:uncharacterized protein YjbI with pentapeptide repeats